MDVQVVALLAGLVGLAVGLVAALAARSSDRARQVPAPPPGDGLPPGIAAMVTALPSAAIVLDPSERVLRSSAAARASGLVRGERLTVPELERLTREVLREEDAREAEIDVPRRRGGNERAHFAVQVAPLGVDYVLITAFDQTQLRRAETVRRDFVANVSHELKTPVGALALLAETIEAAADDPEAVRRFSDRMHHEAARLTALVQELITLSRIQDDDPVPHPVPVRADTVVNEAVDRCRLSATQKDIALVADGPLEQPNPAEHQRGLFVHGDQELLVTAVRNLIDNAIAYSPEHTRVAVSARQDGDSVLISVADQGIGITQKDRERIFERFYRVDPARSRATGGTGLGLAIVKHVATSHGGDIRVWSEENIGSTFTITLPARGRSEAAGEPSAAPQPKRQVSPQTHHRSQEATR